MRRDNPMRTSTIGSRAKVVNVSSYVLVMNVGSWSWAVSNACETAINLEDKSERKKRYDNRFSVRDPFPEGIRKG